MIVSLSILRRFKRTLSFLILMMLPCRNCSRQSMQQEWGARRHTRDWHGHSRCKGFLGRLLEVQEGSRIAGDGSNMHWHIPTIQQQWQKFQYHGTSLCFPNLLSLASWSNNDTAGSWILWEARMYTPTLLTDNKLLAKAVASRRIDSKHMHWKTRHILAKILNSTSASQTQVFHIKRDLNGVAHNCAHQVFRTTLGPPIFSCSSSAHATPSCPAISLLQNCVWHCGKMV
jgi:hypothetical protein